MSLDLVLGTVGAAADPAAMDVAMAGETNLGIATCTVLGLYSLLSIRSYRVSNILIALNFLYSLVRAYLRNCFKRKQVPQISRGVLLTRFYGDNGVGYGDGCGRGFGYCEFLRYAKNNHAMYDWGAGCTVYCPENIFYKELQE